MTTRAMILTAAASLAIAAGLTGCLKRTISITTEPAGALVWLNDVEVGRTPLDVDFTFYGTYDVRLDLDGYEPIVTSREAKTPLYEYPGIDLIAEAIPANIETTIRWHFDLRPTIEAALPPDRAADRLLDRARAFQAHATGIPQSTPPTPPPTADAGTPTTTDPGATDLTTTPPAPTTPP